MGDETQITIGLAVVILGGIAAAWWRLEGRFDEERNARDLLAADLAAYKLYVAQNHVTSQALRETEERLVTAFEKVATRLETIVARLDRLALDMARAGAVSDP
jgi:hypothetical protein